MSPFGLELNYAGPNGQTVQLDMPHGLQSISSSPTKKGWAEDKVFHFADASLAAKFQELVNCGGVVRHGGPDKTAVTIAGECWDS